MDVSSLVGSSCVCMSSLQGKKMSAILANGVRRRLMGFGSGKRRRDAHGLYVTTRTSCHITASACKLVQFTEGIRASGSSVWRTDVVDGKQCALLLFSVPWLFAARAIELRDIRSDEGIRESCIAFITDRLSWNQWSGGLRPK